MEFLPICWGAHYTGLYYTAISSRLTAPEMAYIINDCGAGAFITSTYKAQEAIELEDDIPHVSLRLSVGGNIDGYDQLEELLAEQPIMPVGPRVEGADMLYSSGTTGRPKGVKVPLPETALGDTDGVTALLGLLLALTKTPLFIYLLPPYITLRHFASAEEYKIGGTVIVMPRFDPIELLESIQEYKATFMQVVPTMFVRLLKLDKTERETFDVSSLESVVHAAAPCNSGQEAND